MTLLCALLEWFEETEPVEAERLYIASFHAEMLPEDRQLMHEHLRQAREMKQFPPLNIYLFVLYVMIVAAIQQA